MKDTYTLHQKMSDIVMFFRELRALNSAVIDRAVDTMIAENIHPIKLLSMKEVRDYLINDRTGLLLKIQQALANVEARNSPNTAK